MIYLIDDDRRSLQQIYGVNYLNESPYDKVIQPIYRLSAKDDIAHLATADCILLHESFPDFNADGEILQGQNTISQKIRALAREKKIPLVIFSNGILELAPDQIAALTLTSLNKKLFYENLEEFLKRFIDEQKIILKILPYGPHFVYSELLGIYAKIAQIINSGGVDDYSPKIQPYVAEFASKTDHGASIIAKSTASSGPEFLKYLEKICQSVFNYGKNIYP